MQEKWMKLLMAGVLLVFGLTAVFSYETILHLILNAALLFSFLVGIFRIYAGFRKKDTLELIIGLVSLLFGAVLLFYNFIPEWLIRVLFGMYCCAIGISILIQQGIYLYNEIHSPLSGWFFSCAYCVLGFSLLFSPQVSTGLLMQSFGIYFMLLSIRFLFDAFNLNSQHYKWHRFIHVSVPTALAPFIPDYYLSKIQRMLQEDEPVEREAYKTDEQPKLRAMVHIGPQGLQKVGHFTFAWEDIVFSYGNYDVDSTRMAGLMGDGVYFTVPYDLYLPNIMEYEHNTIFEYGIHTTPAQDAQIEAALQHLKNNSFRWYSKIEKNPQIGRIEGLEEDYPCRLHFRTGAKFYKIKKGRFHTYWATGENCVLFADQILGMVGADVLSVKGIVSPGAYFDYLQNEYAKENSPVVRRIIHTMTPKGKEA